MRDIKILQDHGVNLAKSLELFCDMETYDATVEDFLSTIDKKIEEVKSYKEVADMNNYAILVHSLKSDCRYLGFDHLADLFYDHELKSKEGNIVYVYDHYADLMTELEQMIDVIYKYLGKENKKKTEPIKVISKDKKILVVDDSNIIRNLIQKIFTDEFEVIPASDGEEALNVISKEEDLYGMLLDLNMPNVNGFEVLHYFREHNLFGKIPVVIVTGDDSKETVDRAFEYSIVDVINKPFNERDIKKAVTSMINFH